MASTIARTTALRAGSACVRCRKGKTKCVYENGRAPCRNCAKGMHECYLPSESTAHHHGQTPGPARPRPRDTLGADRSVAAGSSNNNSTRHLVAAMDKLTPEFAMECERVISKSLPASVAFHKPSFIQQLKQGTLEPVLVNALLSVAAKSSPALIRRFGSQSGAEGASEHFALKTSRLINESLDSPSLGDIQALCLLIIHEWGMRNAVRAYVHLGQAARMAQMHNIINMHRKLANPEKFIQEESFRRVIWLIYILDCFLTSSAGRLPALSSHDFSDISLPCQDMNFQFGTPVVVRTLSGAMVSHDDTTGPPGEFGEFGHIVLATQVWRKTVEMLTATREMHSEERCRQLEQEIASISQNLPSHFVDKPGQINVHITMGSGHTYAMIHCLLHCSTIFVNRRRVLAFVANDSFSADDWSTAYVEYYPIVEAILSASHSIAAMFEALDPGSDKDSIMCFPLFMLFSLFTASSTTAYIALKGLMLPNSTDTIGNIVHAGLRLLSDAVDHWPLVAAWYRHLNVMYKILDATLYSAPAAQVLSGDEAGSNGDDATIERTDYLEPPENPQTVAFVNNDSRGSEPPQRRPGGFTTVNGSSVGVATPVTISPPQVKSELPERPASAGAAAELASGTGAPPPSAPEMTPAELCKTFEKQLLDFDDLAAFMGGGV